MKQIFTMFLVFWGSNFIYSQNQIETEYFKFKCDCTQNENYFNSKNQSYNYSYVEKDGVSGFLLAIREMKYRDKTQQNDFLSSIKNSNTFSYQEIQFAGETALLATITDAGRFGRQIIFFHNNIAYTVMIVSNKKDKLDELYYSFTDSFKFN